MTSNDGSLRRKARLFAEQWELKDLARDLRTWQQDLVIAWARLGREALLFAAAEARSSDGS